MKTRFFEKPAWWPRTGNKGSPARESANRYATERNYKGWCGKTNAGAARATALLLCAALALSGCAQLATWQNSPTTQAIETAAISIGISLASHGAIDGAWVAPGAVASLTAIANKKSPFSVSGTNPIADAALLTSTLAAAVPSDAGKTAAVSVAKVYLKAMTAPGVTATPASANATLAAIASGLSAGIQKAQ